MLRDAVDLFATSGWRRATRLIRHSLRLRRAGRSALTLLVLQGLERNGLCDLLLRGEVLEPERDGPNATLRAGCEYLCEIGLLEPHGRGFRAASAKRFRDWMGVVYAYMAYGETTQSMAQLIRGEWRYGEHTARDDRYDAIASAALTSSFSYRFAANLIEGSSATRVVDLGCGTGAFPAFLADRFPKGQFWGVDLADEAIAEGRAAGLEHKRVQLVVGDITDLKSVPLGTARVDLFSLMFVLHEFDDQRVAAILRSIGDGHPNASVLLIELTGQRSAEISRRSVFPELKLVHEISGQILRDADEWKRLFRESGFVPVAEKHNALTNHIGLRFAPILRATD